ncbi:MAG: citramalate synthase [Chitinivibrionales bacterium]|nr:citramalate synthase [Chitinivibrionales bacterium]MBD3395614.1 citramalate synthase [Chitinivibrionales bacterium]
MPSKKKVTLYDTTLRDGNQAIGIGLSLSDKLDIAERLDALGVHYIEGGWPNPGNTTDREFYQKVAGRKLKSKIAVFGSTRRPGTKCSADPFLKALVSANAPVATVFGKSWDLHVRKIIGTSMSENLDMIGESVAYLKRHKDEVLFDAEHFFDGYRAHPEYALKTLEVARQAGADVLVLCDTNGGMLPGEFLEMFRATAAKIDASLGVHMHNDAGCAEANTFLGVQEGAVQIQGTINGLGERCGNTNLCTVIAGLQIKHGYKLITAAQLKRLTETSVFISEIANVSHNVRHPYVGESAFSHKAGAHADGVRKVRESFEHIDPSLVGNFRRFVVSDQAGRSNILEKLSTMYPGLDKNDSRVKKVLAEIKRLESAGYHFEAADGSFRLLVERVMGNFRAPFSVRGFRVTEEQRDTGELFSEATIKVEENGQFEHTAAEGDGPVNALDNALRKALIKFFPSLAEVRLDDFKVRVLDGSEGTGAKVRVLIESSDGKERWGTVGVSTNIIEASWIALIDSLLYKLLKEQTSWHSNRERR